MISGASSPATSKVWQENCLIRHQPSPSTIATSKVGLIGSQSPFSPFTQRLTNDALFQIISAPAQELYELLQKANFCEQDIFDQDTDGHNSIDQQVAKRIAQRVTNDIIQVPITFLPDLECERCINQEHS